MNKMQLTAIQEVMMKRLYTHFKKLNTKEPTIDPAVTKFIEKSKALVAEAVTLNKALKNKYKNACYEEIDNAGYNSFKGYNTSSVNGEYITFPATSTSGQYFYNNALAEDAKNAIASVENYILQLTLGTSTLDEMDALLKTLTK